MSFIYGYSHMYFGKKIAFSIHFALTFEKLMPGWRFLRSLFLLLHVNKENWFPGCAPFIFFFWCLTVLLFVGFWLARISSEIVMMNSLKFHKKNN